MNGGRAVLACEHSEKRLEPLRAVRLDTLPKGWMRVIREVLGMTTRQFGARMGIGASRIPVIEKAEVTDATTLRILRQTVAAMN